MPWYRIAYRPSVVTDLAGVDKPMAQRLLDKTKWLASNAENLQHVPLSSALAGLSKYAVGEWRIFYSVDPVEHQVEVHMIAHRNDIK